jgi:hypothetical protein
MARAGWAAAIAVALLLTAEAQAPAPAPSPSPSTLPEIGRTHARGVCTTVRDAVAPMVAGLMKSDEVIGAGHRAFAKMGHDMISRNPDQMDLDRLYLARVAAAMAHNLGLIDKLLADENRFPKHPKSDDERIAQTLAAQLRAVADQQRKALDLFNGVAETDAMGRMQNEFNKGLGPGDTVTGPVGSSDPSGKSDVQPPSFLGAAALPMNNAPPGADPRAVHNAPQTNAGALATSAKASGHTIYDQLETTLEQRQAAIAQAEYQLTPTVVGISVACRAELSATPAPRTP